MIKLSLAYSRPTWQEDGKADALNFCSALSCHNTTLSLGPTKKLCMKDLDGFPFGRPSPHRFLDFSCLACTARLLLLLLLQPALLLRHLAATVHYFMRLPASTGAGFCGTAHTHTLWQR